MSTMVECKHTTIRWLHNDIEQDCPDCSAGGNPCSEIICVSCGESVVPTTSDHRNQLGGSQGVEL